ncbi:hypothetical protein [Vibrio alginolyticus]|uniref:hypothetical protein n=1 Tax=Vibrio alginolyticus TaxID=663 RepID=UPI00215FBA70|nr:hypothetical protein [Vibrio alginolyticus]MCS0106548.1 hypothetical protein [Vibrio alginolyticus]
MTQNIEQRTLAAAKLIEQSGLASHEYVTTESEHYTKPTGEKGLSVAGINNIALRTISSNQAAFDSQSKQNQTKFDTQDATQKNDFAVRMAEFESKFQTQYTYKRVGPWVANLDLTVDDHKDVAFEYPTDSGEWYAPKLSLLPFNTGNVFTKEQYSLVSAADQNFTQTVASKSARLAASELIAPLGSVDSLRAGDIIPAVVGKAVISDKLHSVYPISLSDRTVSHFENGRLYFTDGSMAHTAEIKNEKKLIFNKTNTIERDVSFTDFIIEAMLDHEEVIIDGVEVWLSERTVPKAANIRKLTVKNGGLVRFDDLELTIEAEGKSFVLDLRDGGNIHCGLRKALVARDHAPGETVIDVVDASDLRVGDSLATSMMGDDGYGNKWANALRNSGDSYNIITDIQGNKVTVSNPVGMRGLVKNTWIGNAKFGKAGLYFKGANRSMMATILGGNMEEAAAGYYVSMVTEIGEGVDPAYLFVKGTKFKGQFLDGFLLRGEKVNAYFDEDWDIYLSYDNAKQSFVQDTGGDIELRNGKLRRGNYDVEFYPTSRINKLGKVKMHNVECDGRSTLLVKPDQINTITGKPLSDTWTNLGDSLHFTQWSISGSALTVDGFEATKCKFKNYRRSIIGTTFVGIAEDLIVTDDIKMADCYMDCAPHFIRVDGGRGFYMYGDWQYNNLTMNIKYSDVYYLLGFVGAEIESAPKPVFSGITTLKTTSETQYPNSCRVGTMQTLHCIGDESGTSSKVRLVEPYDVDKVIAENVSVFKLALGQDNYLTQTVAMGPHGIFEGQSWRNKIDPVWTDSSDSMLTDGGYVGTVQKKFYRKIDEIANWMNVCKIASLNAPVASCELCIKPAKAYSGSGFIDAKFLLSLSPDNAILDAELPLQSEGLFTIGNNEVKAVAAGLVCMSNTGIADISEFKFRLTDQNVLQINVGGTKDLGMLITVKGNVVDFN